MDFVVNPIVALGVFALLVVVLLLVFWPRHGLVGRVRHLLQGTERVRLEDALKHVHDCEYRRVTCTAESVAGALGVSRHHATRLIARLLALHLVHTAAGVVRLTESGRTEARRILRSHRLWERYLADRTGVDAADWHDEAERLEHTLDAGGVEDLATAMGHPVYDPHGDPIPTAEGVLPPERGGPVGTLRPGQSAKVVHLEDEPREVFEQLVSRGFAPGAHVRLLERTEDLVRLEVDGGEVALEPLVAANVTVVPAAPAAEWVPRATLADLAPGEMGTVVQIAPQCRGPQRRRLLDLGLVPGTPVRAELTSAIRGPVGYRVRGALIALRPQQAAFVRIDHSVDGGAG